MGLRVDFDGRVNAAYIALRLIAPGEAVEQVQVERPGAGTVVLDFTSTGELVGIEVLGASSLLSAQLLADSRHL